MFLSNFLKSIFKRKKKFWLQFTLGVCLIIFLLLNMISIFISYNLLNPERKQIKGLPENLTFEEVSFHPISEDLELKGWFLPTAESKKRTIIFAHGYGGNRLEKFEVAKFLLNNFNVFVFDFRNSGESEADKTTIGQYEKRDLLGAINYIQNRFNNRHEIGLIGYSMGAATAAITAAEKPEIKAVVMDSSFADLKPYLKGNLPVWSELPAFPFNWFILNIGTRLFGVSPAEVRPIKAVQDIDSPIFFIHGQKDNQVPVDNVKKLYEYSSNPRDRIWRVPEAGHVEAAEVDLKNYTGKVIEFFETQL